MRKWIVHRGLGIVLAATVLLAACTASRPPTPTPPPALAGGAAEATQRPTHTATLPPTATQEPSPTPTPNLTATEQAQQVAATATAQAEREQILAQIRHFQQAFEQLAEKYPDGYSGENLKVSYWSKDGEAGLGLTLWPTFSNLIQDFDPEGKILSPDEIRDFLKQHPDARLILAFRGTNAIYCPNASSPMSCRFYPGQGTVVTVLRYNDRFSMIQVENLQPLDEGGEVLLQTRAAAPSDFLGGTLPTKQRDEFRRWAEWQIEGYWLLEDKIEPVGGFKGRTKEISWDQSGYSTLAGKADVLSPEEVELLLDVDMLSLLYEKRK